VAATYKFVCYVYKFARYFKRHLSVLIRSELLTLAYLDVNLTEIMEGRSGGPKNRSIFQQFEFANIYVVPFPLKP